MSHEILIKKLDSLKAYRKDRLALAEWILDNPETFPELLSICFKTEDDISFKASWILEYVCEEKMDLLVPYFDVFFKNLPKVTKDQALRPLSKICLFLTEKHYKKKIALLDSKSK